MVQLCYVRFQSLYGFGDQKISMLKVELLKRLLLLIPIVLGEKQ